MLDAKLFVSVVFSGLAALVIEGVEAVGEAIVVQARTRGGAVKCPGCATPTTRLHAYAQRVPADVPLDGRRVLLGVRIRGMCCDVADCSRRTFREQIPGVLERYQRRTVRLTEQIRATVRELGRIPSRDANTSTYLELTM